MTILHFTVPPMLHYIVSGLHYFEAGHRHIGRHHIGVFDLLVVKSGCLYMGEEELRFEVQAGEMLILRPGNHHFGTMDCTERTTYYWLHFHTGGCWSVSDEYEPLKGGSPMGSELQNSQLFEVRPFTLSLPQYAALRQPQTVQSLLDQLIQLGPSAHLSATPLRQQLLFQEVIQHLTASLNSERSTPSRACAEQTASYLRTHYREDITAKRLGEHLNFHPVYIARCMGKEYGCSPMEYLLHYRIQQSKLLLMQTDYPVARIAEEVGFNHVPYFSSSFAKIEGMSPRKYRQQFS
ncbi:AraC family transcriptional regulator [Paenibacillus sp. NPDC058177]|uniref:helix-turn-helix transcriptional regulator n=1 Tax=Paenibacillus sp. NPDC058177 TaxID=3346369 RepID=UPI0036D954FC